MARRPFYKRWETWAVAAIASVVGGGIGLTSPAIRRLARADERHIARGTPDTPPSRQSVKAGYEVKDFNARDMALILGSIAGTVAVLIGGIFFMAGHLDRVYTNHYAAAFTSEQVATVHTPLPHLEVHPLANYAAYHAHEMHRLSQYRYLDASHSRARIPIYRAMAIEAGRGLDQAP